MQSRRPLMSMLLAAALAVGQWLAAAHEPDHALQPTAAHACAVCVHTHGAGAGAVSVAPHVALDGVVAAPETSVAASPLAATLRHHPIRGPPSRLA